MGVSVADSLQRSGHRLYWLPAGRSPQTWQRAKEHQLIPTDSIKELSRKCTVIISVCPPQAAEAVARQVVAVDFHGLYIDANAISPQLTNLIASVIERAGANYVDGGIIGGPAWEPGTSLFLSGPRAYEAASLFTTGPLEVKVISEQVGKASALKMCYAAYSKGSTALLAAVLAAAEKLEVRVELENEWASEDASFVERTHQRTRKVTAKAWRFTGEMAQIASTFQGAGLPPGFHLAAEELYQRLAHFKDADKTPSLEEVLVALTEPQ